MTRREEIINFLTRYFFIFSLSKALVCFSSTYKNVHKTDCETTVPRKIGIVCETK